MSATVALLAAARGHTATVVAGRIGAASRLALVAAAGGLVALATRTGITEPVRAVASTVLVAFIHLALGMIVGTLVRSEMNGALLVTHPCVLHGFSDLPWGSVHRW